LDIAFDKLIRLQDVDIEIAAYTALLEAVPARLAAFDADTQAAAEVVVKAKDKLAANQKKRRDLEGEVKTVKEQAAKFKRQLNDVKTNKEYTALLKEIEEARHKTDGIEEDILNEMIAADDIEKEIKAANAKKAADEARIHVEKQTVLAEKASLEEKKAALEKERAGILPEIPPDQVRLYDRIALRMRGVALSPIKDDDFCSLCQMRVRPQMLNELLEMKQIILCEACGRILYLPKPAGEAAHGPVVDISVRPEAAPAAEPAEPSPAPEASSPAPEPQAAEPVAEPAVEAPPSPEGDPTAK
jgi:predicted  nucleic acid-binding Zn-ribbon protein